MQGQPITAPLDVGRSRPTGALASVVGGLRVSAALGGRAWRWWVGEMAALLPARMRRLARRRSDILLIDLSEKRIAHVQDGAVQTIRPFPEPDGTPETIRAFTKAHLPKRHVSVVRLPATQVLLKDIELPAEAEANVRQILGFEIDRRTPFKPEDVFFDACIRGRSADGRALHVDWVIAPRDAVIAAQRLATDCGVRPDIVDARCREPGRPGLVNLIPAEPRQVGAGISRRLSLLLGALALLLGLGAIYVPVQRHEAALAELGARIDDARRQADEAARLRAERDRLAQANRFGAERKLRSLSVVQVIDDLTRLLPDDTWISDLQIVERDIHISGATQSASALVALLEQSQAFRNVRFRSPVTPTPAGDRERFHVSFEPRRDAHR
jgi:general secretion pathway protein L